MPFVKVVCPSCGGEIQIDNSRETGFCLYCGTKIINTDNLPQAGDLLKIAEAAYDEEDYPKSIAYLTKALQVDADNWKAILLKEYSKIRISSLKDDLFSMALENTKRVLAIAKDRIQDTVEFDSLFSNTTDFIEKRYDELLDAFEYKWWKYFDPELEFDNLDIFDIYLRDLRNCILGHEYIISINKEKLSFIHKEFFHDARILNILSLVSKHHKVKRTGKWCSIDSQSRKMILTKWDEIIAKPLPHGYLKRKFDPVMGAHLKYCDITMEQKDVEGDCVPFNL